MILMWNSYDINSKLLIHFFVKQKKKHFGGIKTSNLKNIQNRHEMSLFQMFQVQVYYLNRKLKILQNLNSCAKNILY